MDMLAGGETALEDRTGLPGVDPTLVRAVGRRNGELFIVLDIAALLGRFCLLKERAVSHTVLVCDDAIFMRTMITDILAQAGFEVVGEAETGTQAVEKYRQLSRTWSPWTS